MKNTRPILTIQEYAKFNTSSFFDYKSAYRISPIHKQCIGSMISDPIFPIGIKFTTSVCRVYNKKSTQRVIVRSLKRLRRKKGMKYYLYNISVDDSY